MTAPEQGPTTDDLAFYQHHLDQVSRSFAVCIAELEAPLRQWTSLAYLLCRALDTIEDSLWTTTAQQDAAYSAFEGFVQAPAAPERLAAWTKTFPATAQPAELLLIADAGQLFAALHALPEAVASPMRDAVLRMSTGMRHYSLQAAKTGGLRLTDSRDVNRYCYFVAGLVGHLLTALFVQAHPSDWEPPALVWRHAFDFGLFLQKINLLKDQRTDEMEGRFLVPDRALLRASLRGHIDGAVAYLTALPQSAQRYRTFCGWSLFLGAASLPSIEAGQSGESAPKMPRHEAMALMQTVAKMAQDDAALRTALTQYAHVLPEARSKEQAAASAPDADDEWFIQAAGALLRPADLTALGLR